MRTDDLFTHDELAVHRSRTSLLRRVLRREHKTFPPLPEVITLVGSTRFKEQHLAAMAILTLRGAIVIPCGLYGHADAVQWPKIEDEKVNLDRLHFRKIDASDSIFVINAYTDLCCSCRKPANVTWNGILKFIDPCKTCGIQSTYSGPYVGPSSRNEISYALATGKRVYWLNPEHAILPDALPAFDPAWLASEVVEPNPIDRGTPAG